MPVVKQALLIVLQEARTWLSIADNDFAWSRWEDSAEALAELDQNIRAIEENRHFDPMDLAILFAPTGSIQEVSLGSGWGREFCDVAARFDEAFAAYQRQLLG